MKLDWQSNGVFFSETYRIIFAGRDMNERGVGLMHDMEKCVLEYCQISGRILLVKARKMHFNIAIIIAYAPIAEDETYNIYNLLGNANVQCKSQEFNIIMADNFEKEHKSEIIDMFGGNTCSVMHRKR